MEWDEKKLKGQKKCNVKNIDEIALFPYIVVYLNSDVTLMFPYPCNDYS